MFLSAKTSKDLYKIAKDAKTSKDLYKIAKFAYGNIYLREFNLSFQNNYIFRNYKCQ